jgi:hypothetical protein
MSYLNRLRDAIHALHGGKATHIESVPVKETWNGETIWDGIVEVFDLHDHPKAGRVYAWPHKTDSYQDRHVTVLHLPPVVDPITAVRAAIVQEYQNAQTA